MTAYDNGVGIKFISILREGYWPFINEIRILMISAV